MSHNKMLNAAIVAALSVGGGTALAADPSFDITAPVNATPTVAIELFNPNSSAVKTLPCADKYETKYTLGLENDVESSFTVVYTLTGATWETLPLANQFLLEGAGSTPSIFYQAVDDTSVTYVVDANTTNKVDKDAQLVLKDFNIDVVEKTFAATGQTAKLTVTITIGETTIEAMVDLVKSGVGVAVNFSTAGTKDLAIDVGTGGTKFTDGASTQTYAKLGTITVGYPTTKLVGCDLKTPWGFTSDAEGVVKGTLKIENGPFAASTSGNRVFVDSNGSGCSAYQSDDDFAAAVNSDGQTATWSFSEGDMETLFGSATDNNICVMVPGNAAINETDDAPSARMTVDYKNHTGMSAPEYPLGNLLHIKKNGVICTLYNVTDGSSVIDKTNIRVTNRATQTGTLTGSLRDQTGTSVFTDVVLATNVVPNQTVYVNSADLLAKAAAAGYPDEGKFGRGVLTIGSDLISMEVFGLLRNNSVSGSGPLLNMSLGASGDGCD